MAQSKVLSDSTSKNLLSFYTIDMTHLNFSDDWRKILAAYSLGTLTAQELRQVNQYLNQHPKMQAEVQQIQTALALWCCCL
jgi:anti-sigma-K factor RskA